MDVYRRSGIYGQNQIALPVISSFDDLLAQQFEDQNVIFLIGASTVYLLFSLFDDRATGHIEALTIYSGVMFASIMAALSDYVKERQYLKLADEANKETCVVYRGAYGMGIEIPVQEVVVGDIIEVRAGYRVPADCLLVEEMNMKVDQSMYWPDQTNVEKECSREIPFDDDGPEDQEKDNHKRNPDPFLLTGCKIMSGAGKALILSLGKNTHLARNRKKEDLVL
jgi:Ca2+-transporting ATPase